MRAARGALLPAIGAICPLPRADPSSPCAPPLGLPACAQIDKFLYSTDNYIKAGALLAVGLLNTGVRNECDPALALLTEYVEGSNPMMKISALFGLGMAYVGSQKEEVRVTTRTRLPAAYPLLCCLCWAVPGPVCAVPC